MRRRAWLVGAGAGAAALASQRIRPLPCPYAARWVLWLPRPFLGRARLLAVLDPRPGERILDLGAGIGFYSLPVAEQIGPAGRLHALDLQPDMVATVGRRAATAGLDNVEARLGDARRLPFADATLDAAYLVTVLGEVPDQHTVLAELRRVLRPGARLVVGEIPLADPHFVRARVLRRRAEAAGFRFAARSGPPFAFLARFVRP